MSRTAKISDDKKQLNPLKPAALDPLPEQPLVSILISNYNYGAYLGEAIESALQQTYDKLEIVICDDGSTDGSPRILERYRSLDRRIRVVYQANGGQSLALNAAFHKSTGDIICLLDADDVFMPDKVRRVVEAFGAAPESGLAAYADTLIQVLAPRITPIVAVQTPSSEYRVHGANVAAVSAFTEDRLRNLVVWEREIWCAWRRHTSSSSAPSLDTPVSETTPTLMAYAYARFRSDPRSKAVYQAIPPDYFRALPRLFRWYWRASRVMPNWLFRRSFAFVYGQTRTKRVVARILTGSRSNVRERKRLFERVECTRHQVSNTKRNAGMNETAGCL